MTRKKYILQKTIDEWFRVHNLYNGKVIKLVAAKILRINSQTITNLSVTNRCMNVFTKRYLFKIQLYGNNVERDINNRKFFSSHAKSLVSPINIYEKKPLTFVMPLLDKPILYDESACYILNELAKCGHKVTFKIRDYSLINVGLNIIRDCEYGELARKRIYKYLREKEGVQIRVGLVHGDFHRGNIMHMDGKPILIDFDCARENDVQAIDALYYVLEEVGYKHRHSESWLGYWISVYKNIASIEEHICLEQVDVDLKFGLILLLLERLAQDVQYDYSFVSSKRDAINKINKLFVGEM